MQGVDESVRRHRPGRTQEERSATTRAALADAAIGGDGMVDQSVYRLDDRIVHVVAHRIGGKSGRTVLLVDDACRDADLILASGGSSVGERDLIIDLVRRRGTLVFHGIAVKPGKPTLFATVNSRPFFGMPGNPTSCLSNAYILLVPFLRATARLPLYAPRVTQATIGRRIVSVANRHQFYTVRLRDGAAFPAFKGSGDITSLALADGYIEIPIEVEALDAGNPSRRIAAWSR